MIGNEKEEIIKAIIDEKKNEFIGIMKDYIDHYCVQFKKEKMKTLFVDKFVDLAESMTRKFTKENEGRIYINSNDFSKDMENQNRSNNVSLINSNKSNITNPSL